mmetsp:Transcript_1873/g.4366  ORF Transcript_1873/g.4366 Transcript_1873/m.4366 type:complete len:202 (+) Transcript_1873:616-1221(+)
MIRRSSIHTKKKPRKRRGKKSPLMCRRRIFQNRKSQRWQIQQTPHSRKNSVPILKNSNECSSSKTTICSWMIIFPERIPFAHLRNRLKLPNRDTAATAATAAAREKIISHRRSRPRPLGKIFSNRNPQNHRMPHSESSRTRVRFLDLMFTFRRTIPMEKRRNETTRRCPSPAFPITVTIGPQGFRIGLAETRERPSAVATR